MSFTCVKGCGECCGIQPVSQKQLQAIQKALKKMPMSERFRLSKQKRPPMTCPLRDMEKDRCSVYLARPEICRMFGYYEGLVCPHFPEYATGKKEEGFNRLGDEEPVGVLGLDITWGHGL